MLFMVTLECPNFLNNLSQAFPPRLSGSGFCCMLLSQCFDLVTGCVLPALHFQGMSIAFLPRMRSDRWNRTRTCITILDDTRQYRTDITKKICSSPQRQGPESHIKNIGYPPWDHHWYWKGMEKGHIKCHKNFLIILKQSFFIQHMVFLFVFVCLLLLLLFFHLCEGTELWNCQICHFHKHNLLLFSLS